MKRKIPKYKLKQGQKQNVYNKVPLFTNYTADSSFENCNNIDQ